LSTNFDEISWKGELCDWLDFDGDLDHADPGIFLKEFIDCGTLAMLTCI